MVTCVDRTTTTWCPSLLMHGFPGHCARHLARVWVVWWAMQEVLTIVSMLQVENIFYRPRDKQAVADQKRAKFFAPEGDHITLLAVYNGWKAAKFSNPWAHDNFIQVRSLRRAQDVRKQLVSIMDRYKLDVSSCGRDFTRVCKVCVRGVMPSCMWVCF
jgi:HrpA-like RNA helicase